MAKSRANQHIRYSHIPIPRTNKQEQNACMAKSRTNQHIKPRSKRGCHHGVPTKTAQLHQIFPYTLKLDIAQVLKLRLDIQKSIILYNACTGARTFLQAKSQNEQMALRKPVCAVHLRILPDHPEISGSDPFKRTNTAYLYQDLMEK
ncbi:hypothetical protein SK128_018258 [Halocaridina rubra]|uniref:Uncharacterized protein n=1 Tax=Halocaridina rubra TaxID=373956 RepID=A0AAN8WJ12_HALRR